MPHDRPITEQIFMVAHDASATHARPLPFDLVRVELTREDVLEILRQMDGRERPDDRDVVLAGDRVFGFDAPEGLHEHPPGDPLRDALFEVHALGFPRSSLCGLDTRPALQDLGTSWQATRKVRTASEDRPGRVWWEVGGHDLAALDRETVSRLERKLACYGTGGTAQRELLGAIERSDPGLHNTMVIEARRLWMAHGDTGRTLDRELVAGQGLPLAAETRHRLTHLLASPDPATRRSAEGFCDRLELFDEDLLVRMLGSEEPSVRTAGVRLARERGMCNEGFVTRLLGAEKMRVREAGLRLAGELEAPEEPAPQPVR